MAIVILLKNLYNNIIFILNTIINNEVRKNILCSLFTRYSGGLSVIRVMWCSFRKYY